MRKSTQQLARSCGMHTIRRSKPVVKGYVSPMLSVPRSLSFPEYAETGEPIRNQSLKLYNEEEIIKVRRAARLARKMLEYANSLVEPGITTDEIDRLTHLEIIRNGAYPAPLNYCSFPKSICTSVNEVACHGIPDSRPLVDGDVISIDVSLYIDGFHGDNCGTVPVGKVDDSILRLIDCTKEAVDRAIAAIGPGKCLSNIGNTIETFASKNNYSVIHEFCGHGTGQYLHMLPYVLHHKNTARVELRPGMVFTIEPILVEGSRKLENWKDGWTASTFDGGWSAQIEHEVLITDDGVEVLTILE